MCACVTQSVPTDSDCRARQPAVRDRVLSPTSSSTASASSRSIGTHRRHVERVLFDRTNPARTRVSARLTSLPPRVGQIYSRHGRQIYSCGRHHTPLRSGSGHASVRVRALLRALCDHHGFPDAPASRGHVPGGRGAAHDHVPSCGSGECTGCGQHHTQCAGDAHRRQCCGNGQLHGHWLPSLLHGVTRSPCGRGQVRQRAVRQRGFGVGRRRGPGQRIGH